MHGLRVLTVWFFITQSDIRKWFMKQHDKGTGNGSMSKNSAAEKPSPATPKAESLVSILNLDHFSEFTCFSCCTLLWFKFLVMFLSVHYFCFLETFLIAWNLGWAVGLLLCCLFQTFLGTNFFSIDCLNPGVLLELLRRN